MIFHWYTYFQPIFCRRLHYIRLKCFQKKLRQILITLILKKIEFLRLNFESRIFRSEKYELWDNNIYTKHVRSFWYQAIHDFQ